MGEFLIAIGELLLHLFIYSILAAYKLLKFIFHKKSRESLIREWHTSIRDKIEILIGGLLLVGFVSWTIWFFGSAVYEHYNPKEKTLKEKILDKAFKEAVEADDIKKFVKVIAEIKKEEE